IQREELRPAFAWRNAPFIASLSQGIAPPELFTEMRGTVDRFEIDGRPVDAIVAGQRGVATGWALAGGSTPLQAAVSSDGRDPPAATRTFFDRPDVDRVFPGARASGWRIAIDTAGLSPGPHRVSLFLWTAENGDTYFLQNRTLTVQSADTVDLPSSFKT